MLWTKFSRLFIFLIFIFRPMFVYACAFYDIFFLLTLLFVFFPFSTLIPFVCVCIILGASQIFICWLVDIYLPFRLAQMIFFIGENCAYRNMIWDMLVSEEWTFFHRFVRIKSNSQRQHIQAPGMWTDNQILLFFSLWSRLFDCNYK